MRINCNITFLSWSYMYCIAFIISIAYFLFYLIFHIFIYFAIFKMVNLEPHPLPKIFGWPRSASVCSRFGLAWIVHCTTAAQKYNTTYSKNKYFWSFALMISIYRSGHTIWIKLYTLELYTGPALIHMVWPDLYVSLKTQSIQNP